MRLVSWGTMLKRNRLIMSKHQHNVHLHRTEKLCTMTSKRYTHKYVHVLAFIDINVYVGTMEYSMVKSRTSGVYIAFILPFHTRDLRPEDAGSNLYLVLSKQWISFLWFECETLNFYVKISTDGTLDGGQIVVLIKHTSWTKDTWPTI